MKVKIVHVSRCPPWPLWAVMIVTLWLLLVAGAIYLSIYLNEPVQLCMFKRLTGFDCPTCGSTRGVLSLLHGHIIDAWLCNPLLFSGLLIFCIVTAIRIVFASSFKLNLTKTERFSAWILAGLLFFVNWMHIIFYVDWDLIRNFRDVDGFNFMLLDNWKNIRHTLQKLYKYKRAATLLIISERCVPIVYRYFCKKVKVEILWLKKRFSLLL